MKHEAWAVHFAIVTLEVVEGVWNVTRFCNTTTTSVLLFNHHLWDCEMLFDAHGTDAVGPLEIIDTTPHIPA